MTNPRANDAPAMPSWAPANVTGSSFIEARAILANRLPSAAFSSRLGRREAVKANSTATKKPLMITRAMTRVRAPKLKAPPLAV